MSRAAVLALGLFVVALVAADVSEHETAELGDAGVQPLGPKKSPVEDLGASLEAEAKAGGYVSALQTSGSFTMMQAGGFEEEAARRLGASMDGKKGCHAVKQPTTAQIQAMFTSFYNNAQVTGDGTRKGKCLDGKKVIRKLVGWSKVRSTEAYQKDCAGGSVLVRFITKMGTCASLHDGKEELGEEGPVEDAVNHVMSIGGKKKSGKKKSGKKKSGKKKSGVATTVAQKLTALKKIVARANGKPARPLQQQRQSIRSQRAAGRYKVSVRGNAKKRGKGYVGRRGRKAVKRFENNKTAMNLGVALFQMKVASTGKGMRGFGYVDLGTCNGVNRKRCRSRKGPRGAPGPNRNQTWLNQNAIDLCSLQRSKKKYGGDFLTCFKAFYQKLVNGLNKWPPSNFRPPKRAPKAWTFTQKITTIQNDALHNKYRIPAFLYRRYNYGRWKGGTYCKKQGDSLKYKQLLVDCLSKQNSVMTKGTNSPVGSCRFLKAKQLCDKDAAYCHYPNDRMFKRGCLFCGETTGANHCKNRCMQMVLGSTTAGPTAFTKAAKEWRCASKAARGVTCMTSKSYSNVCNAVCSSNKATKTLALNLLVQGISVPYSREALIVKRASSWETYSAGAIGPATSVSGRCWLPPVSRRNPRPSHRCEAKPRKVNAMAVIMYYMDSTKVLMCDRTGSLAEGMVCRSKKEIQVTGLCLKMEAGCVNQGGATCNSITDQAYRTGLTGGRRGWVKIPGWKKGMLKPVLPLTCCSNKDLGCIASKLRPHLAKIGYYKLGFSENWSTLGTTNGLGA